MGMMNEVPNRRQEQIEAFAAGNIAATRHHGARIEPRVENSDPRERLLMLYGVWVKCLPHQAGRRRLVEQAIVRCKSEIAERADERLQCEMNGTGVAVSDVRWTYERGAR